MIKALLKKQMLEAFFWVYKDRKSGKHRDVKGIVFYIVLYLFVFGILGVVFGLVGVSMCEPLLAAGMGWMYWCLMGMIAIFLGVFGSVFNTYSSLYQAKDNDILLSMPIPTSRILLMRLSGVYVMGLMYEMIVMIPAMIIWYVTAPFHILGAVNVLLIPLILSVLVLVLSAILGWVVALVVARIRHKNMITVLLSLIFIAAYYYIYGKAYELLQNFVVNAKQVGEKMKSILYPMYHMGLAAEGSAVSMLIFTGIIALIFVLVYCLLSRNFLRLATTNRGAKKSVYKAQAVKISSVQSALLRKELRRFTGSANYMLNCGIGIILMPICAIMLVWKAGDIRPIFAYFSADILGLGMIGAMCLVVSMNIITAPSISLEGKNLWIIQSFPVAGRDVLIAKIKLHILLTAIPALLPILAMEWLVRPGVFYAVMLPVVTLLFIVLLAMLGLILNLKMPNLDWTNEAVPIKQSLPTMIALFGGWICVVIAAAGYYFLGKYVSATAFTVGIMFLIIVVDYLMLRWLTEKGKKILERL